MKHTAPFLWLINNVLDLICRLTNELRCGKKENGESFLTFSVLVRRQGLEPWTH